MKSSFDVLLEAVERGLTVSVRGDRLAVRPDSALTRDLVDMLRAHKPELLRLLNLPFLIVQSEVLNDIVVFASDDQTKEKLVAAGGEPGIIYTRSELALLVKRRVSADELQKLHEAKRGFHGTITP
jgi:hypothetical protein